MGSPIGLQAVRRSVQPSQSELALSQFMSMSHCMPGKNNETEPKRMDQTDVACFASSGTVGIVDLGASRTVVGSQIKEILTGVPESIRAKIRRTQFPFRQPSDPEYPVRTPFSVRRHVV